MRRLSRARGPEQHPSPPRQGTCSRESTSQAQVASPSRAPQKWRMETIEAAHIN